MDVPSMSKLLCDLYSKATALRNITANKVTWIWPTVPLQFGQFIVHQRGKVLYEVPLQVGALIGCNYERALPLYQLPCCHIAVGPLGTHTPFPHNPVTTVAPTNLPDNLKAFWSEREKQRACVLHCNYLKPLN